MRRRRGDGCKEEGDVKVVAYVASKLLADALAER
jgi:hypothetical protein